VGQASLAKNGPEAYQKYMEKNDPIIELEIKLSEAMRLAEELSDVVAEQANRLEIAERRIQMLMERAAQDEANASNGMVMNDAPPPHW
jgi:SlyX protein